VINEGKMNFITLPRLYLPLWVYKKEAKKQFLKNNILTKYEG